MNDNRPETASHEIDIMRVMQLLPHRYPFLMPGVLIIESMAQTAGALVVETLGEGAMGKLVYFMVIDSARFRKPVMPGDVLHIHVHIRRRRGNVWKFDGQAKVDGSLVAEATYSAMIMDE